ncbi:MAG: 23S rRNA (adenine(2503)-C(2))-methyltransferase RlmN [Actinobacteria bacterium]|nr:MAG: 23S rRNA (adenine(2503)-C(2))-methyltransferase RlmN [Actinomycetota bacterium]
MTGGATDIKSLDLPGIERALAALGQPRFRVRQLVRWLYARGVAGFDEMTDLPGALRSELAERFTLGRLSLSAREVSADGTRKYLWELPDKTTVESVGIPSGDRLTVCFSTQAGCAMGCTFCATGQDGLTRSLLPGEMVDQVLGAAADMNARVSNAVAMGQGEPFANYDATLGALRFMNSPDGLEIGARHLTVSTCGLLPGIRRFSAEPEQFTLAVSLHSAVQSTRDVLMPGVARYPLDQLREALATYGVRTGRRPTLEFALVAGSNDSDSELKALIAFCRGMLCHVNLIPVNPVTGSDARRPDDARVRAFASALTSAGIECTIRTERGVDISAACGQLRQRHRA